MSNQPMTRTRSYQQAREQLRTRLLIIAIWVLANALGWAMLVRPK